MEVDGAVGHELGDGCVEAHDDVAVDFEHHPRLRCRDAPWLARRVAVPGAADAHVGVQDQAVVEGDQQVFAARLDGGNAGAYDTLYLRSGCARPSSADLLADK